ncbi:hypothetical protein IWW55_005657, partial [Coemansia sp. RSA 2706]
MIRLVEFDRLINSSQLRVARLNRHADLVRSQAAALFHAIRPRRRVPGAEWGRHDP